MPDFIYINDTNYHNSVKECSGISRRCKANFLYSYYLIAFEIESASVSICCIPIYSSMLVTDSCEHKIYLNLTLLMLVSFFFYLTMYGASFYWVLSTFTTYVFCLLCKAHSTLEQFLFFQSFSIQF